MARGRSNLLKARLDNTAANNQPATASRRGPSSTARPRVDAVSYSRAEVDLVASSSRSQNTATSYTNQFNLFKNYCLSLQVYGPTFDVDNLSIDLGHLVSQYIIHRGNTQSYPTVSSSHASISDYYGANLRNPKEVWYYDSDTEKGTGNPAQSRKVTQIMCAYKKAD